MSAITSSSQAGASSGPYSADLASLEQAQQQYVTPLLSTNVKKEAEALNALCDQAETVLNEADNIGHLTPALTAKLKSIDAKMLNIEADSPSNRVANAAAYVEFPVSEALGQSPV